jgi:3-deoxy-D-arabino-heptulosonate 7-phosphate (DAHP) synthase class II
MEPEITSSLDSRIPTVVVPAQAPDHGNVIHSSTLHVDEVVDEIKAQIEAATAPGATSSDERAAIFEALATWCAAQATGTGT